MQPDARTVVEIGAGLGALTAALRDEGAHVIAIERDRDLAPLLRARFESDPDVEVLEANALTLDFHDLFARHGVLTVCGNLPYHLTSPLIFRALDHLMTWRRLVVMVQKEVADRMTADPGSRTYGLLSVMLTARVDVEHAFDVPPGAFHPPPKVHSSVVVMTPRKVLLPGAELPEVRRVARSAFGARRKTLRNALKPLTGEPDLWLNEAGIDPTLRAERLSVEDFGRLAQAAARHPQLPVTEDEDAAEEPDA